MARALYLEPVGGIAGDMFLAAVVDLGVDPAAIVAPLKGLPLGEWSFEVSKASRQGVSGTHVEVKVVSPSATERSFAEIRRMVEGAESLSRGVRRQALGVFEVLARAEAKVHAVPLEEVHFHEVGAVDSVVDVCGAAVALELLGSPEVYAAPPPLGSGLVQTSHGVLPVPAPATLEVLKGVPVRFEGTGELTTPTGAALVKALCRVEAPGDFVVEKVGVGVGTRHFEDRPNVLRATLGQRLSTGEGVVEVEVNLDDLSPQLLAGLVEQLFEQGALDATVAPVTMKKGRSGHLLGLLVPEGMRESVVETLFRETTTLGVRWHRVERAVLERRHEEVSTRFGKIRIKVGHRGGVVLNALPEYEDCRAAARGAGVSTKVVWGEALAAFRK